VHRTEGRFVDGEALFAALAGLGRVEFALERAGALGQLAEQLRRDGEQIAAGQLDDFVGVTEACAHHLGLMAVLFEVVVNARHRHDAGVFRGRVGVAPRLLLVPIENAPDEGRNQRDAGVGAGNGLVQPEEQRQVAVNALALELLGRANALPGGGDFDENAVARHVRRLVKLDETVRLGDGLVGVEREARIDLGRDPTGDDFEDLPAEGDRQPVHRFVDHLFGLGAGRRVALRVGEGALDHRVVGGHLRGRR
jgi:hypothetical protein